MDRSPLARVARDRAEVFRDGQQGGGLPFLFDNLAEGACDATGNSTPGRYTVVFGGNWSQTILGESGSKVISLTNDTDLKFAGIDLSLYHVSTGILRQLRPGFIVGFASLDLRGSPFPA